MVDVAAIHRELIEAINRQDLVRYRELLHDEYTYVGADGVEHVGPAAGVAQVEPFLKGFPDLHLGIDRQFVSGDASIVEVTARGTQTGELAGIPATGRSASVLGCNVIEVRDGKVYRERDYFNEVSLLQQLGVMPAS
jgi:steroid delta-isomerase-like uncharacterized protein